MFAAKAEIIMYKKGRQVKIDKPGRAIAPINFLIWLRPIY